MTCNLLHPELNAGCSDLAGLQRLSDKGEEGNFAVAPGSRAGFTPWLGQQGPTVPRAVPNEGQYRMGDWGSLPPGGRDGLRHWAWCEGLPTKLMSRPSCVSAA